VLRYDKKQKYVLFDFETEGLNLVKSRPWQLAWLVAEGNNIIKQHDRYLFYEDLNVSEGAKVITGFREESYKANAEDPTKVLEDFIEDISSEEVIILGHNIIGFDCYILNSACRDLGIDLDLSYIDRCIDTNCLAKAIALDIQYNNNVSMIEWQYKLNGIFKRKIKTSLEALLKQYEIKHSEGMLHNALYDIGKNFEIFRKQIWEIEI
tara:strand:+ start:18082 stop:18705 length:624 start_codon:yes stop_codon:yes gene_type:complete